MLTVPIWFHQLTSRFGVWKLRFLKRVNAVESWLMFCGFAAVSSLESVSDDNYLEDSLWLRGTRSWWKNTCTLVEFCCLQRRAAVRPCELCFPRQSALDIQGLGAGWWGWMLTMCEYSSSAVNLQSSPAQIHLKIWFKSEVILDTLWIHTLEFLKPW